MIRHEFVVTLTGWKAVAALAAALALFLGWHVSLRAGLKRDLEENLKMQIETALLRPAVDELRARMKEGRVTEASAERLARMPEVEITSVTARGLGSRVVVRVEFLIDGKEAGDLSPKYFVAKHSWSGWIVMQETSGLAYRVAWL